MERVESLAPDLTRTLREATQGRSQAEEVLFHAVYDELRERARSYLRQERKDHTLQATALVHEAYLRLVNQADSSWRDRNHFLAVASRVMRHILVDHARARRRAKRSGNLQRVRLDENLVLGSDPSDTDLLALDLALTRLAKQHPAHARVVELRFFGGMTCEEVADVLDLSPRTVRRHWAYAKARLYEELRSRSPMDEE